MLATDSSNHFFLIISWSAIEPPSAMTKSPWWFWDCSNDTSRPISTKNFEGCFVCDGFDLFSWNWLNGEGEDEDEEWVLGLSLTL